MGSLIHLANLFYIASYFSGDVLRLRVYAVIAGSFLVMYFSLRPEPVMPAVYWNGFFVVMNVVKLQQLRRQRIRKRSEPDAVCETPYTVTLRTESFSVIRMAER